MRYSEEHGIAMITTLLVLMLISALLVGFTTVVMSDQRYRFIDRDRGQAFYGASGALEKLTADLGNVFYRNVAPTDAQVTALTSTASKPTIAGVTFTAANPPSPLAASELSAFHCYTTTGTGGVTRSVRTVGTSGYTISFCANPANNPTTTADPTLIRTGPYADLIALKTPFQLDVTAKTATGGEVHLVRTIEAVAIPVFQFGIFSDVDLAFNAADDFTFGGRVHTNGNLFLAEGGGSTLTIGDKITAVKEVVRKFLSNGVAITDSGHTGTVKIAKGGGSYQSNMQTDWGSVVDGPTSGQNEPLWHTVSLSTYNSYIRNSRTGAKALNLPLITVGGSSPDVTRRPAVNEDNTNPILFNERLFSKASLRILLSDTAADITTLPTVTNTAPVLLDGDWVATPPNNGTAYGPVNISHPPIARTVGPISTTVNANNSTVNLIKVASVASFRPFMSLTKGALTQTITCTAKDIANNRFTGCNVAAAYASPVTLNSAWTSVAVVGAVAAGANVTITVGANNTNPFMPLPFFVSGSLQSGATTNGTLVTCTGWDATPAFTGCLGLPAAPSNNATVTSEAHSAAGTGLIGGFIKIERQDSTGAWTDVTMEILNYGIGGPNVDGTICNADPTPNAIVRIQRLRDNGGGANATANGGGCTYNTDITGAKDPTNWWPNVLYDAREGVQRDDDYPGVHTLTFNGVVHYVSLDVANLSKWFRGTAPFNTGTGTNSITDNGGFTVYFSDRRNNRDEASKETGEYGWEDHVNPNAANGAPNGILDAGENVNGSVVGGVGTQDVYGGRPSYNGTYNTVPPGAPAGSPFTLAATPTTTLTDPMARVNRAIFFRRALKLINGRDIRATGVTGLTVVAENPVYVQGDWNANPGGAGGFTGAHAATAIIADAVTLLTPSWSDVISLEEPYDASKRMRTNNSWYRMAVIAGKSLIFPRPVGTSTTFGTDGGAHAFLRYLEGHPAAGTETINYWGSMATFYYSRQATGVFKGGGTVVYEIPAVRNFAFDTDFKTPALLPPNTPVFRDMNAVGFSQELRPGK
jgi:hypothetical protein